MLKYGGFVNMSRATGETVWGATSGRPLRVLIVDDDGDVRVNLQDVLSTRFEVVGAHNGAAGLAARPSRFDVILLDLSMPVLDGTGFKRALDRQGVRVPVIVMSGECDGRSRSAQMGADDFLPKPVELDALLDRIQAVCARRGRARS
jgi:DNA-binding response OmpR family regulator